MEPYPEQVPRWAGLATDDEGSKSIRVLFPFNEEDLRNVKSLPSRRWDAKNRCWYVPYSIQSAQRLKEWGFNIGAGLLKRIEQSMEESTKIDITKLDKLNIPGLKGELRPFQKQAVLFTEMKEGRILNADEMGMGKTVETLAWIQLHRDRIPVVIVCPATLKWNWERETIKWLPDPKVQVLEGTKPYRITGRIIILNYDILPNWVQTLKALHPQILITDESHYFKSNKAKRTKAIKQLGKNIPHVLALSGTPIVNRPVEAFNAIHLVNHNIVPTYWEFAQRYCAPKHNGYGWDFSGASNTDELHELLINSIMIRRLKKDYLKELPDKVHSFIPIELDNQGEYNLAESDFISFVRNSKGREAAERASNAQAFAEIEGLKQIAVKGKISQAVTWVEDFFTSDSGKLVVYARHKFVIDALMTVFNEIAVKIDGSIAVNKRQNVIDQFQNNPDVKLIVISDAGGVGITLTAASTIAILELPWTPGQLDQIIDRLHRIGQKDTVNIYYLLARDTIEEKIAYLLDKKRKVISSVLDGEDVEMESLLMELMNEYN